MTTKHTPGPWKFHEQGDANQYCLLTKKDRWVISFSQNGELNTPEQIANAKLIAAAPELLKACIAVMGGGYGCAPSVEFMDDLKIKCELAIKKATE